MPEAKLLILDANVLIDFANSELRVISLASRQLGSVLVSRSLLREVGQLDEQDCERLEIMVIDPTVDQLLEAGSVGGALSFEDRLCLILARDRGLLCVTNDRRLRSECATCGVEVLWGLELVLKLVERRLLTVERAIQIAEKIHQSNPHHITESIVATFISKAQAFAAEEAEGERD